MRQHDAYQATYEQFRWKVPRYFNIAQVCAIRWAQKTPKAIALHYEHENGQTQSVSFTHIAEQSNRLSNALAALGVKRGDRVAIVSPQRPETAIAHMAVYQMGAVAMPMSVLFGPDALQYRYENSACKVALVDGDYLTNTLAASAGLQHVVVMSGDQATDSSSQNSSGQTVAPTSYASPAKPLQLHAWDELLRQSSPQFALVKTLAEDPACLIYTSGTTGPPKGALIAHRCLIGNLTGFVASQNWYPQNGDVFWSPADWAWTGGLMDALLPCMYFGKPIVGYKGRFGPEVAYGLLERYCVTNTFIFPTALKMMMKAEPRPRQRYQLKLRAIMSAGEAVGDALYDWCEQALGVTVNEMFGQTEINYVVGNCAARWPARPGSIGKAMPGHRVELIDENGGPVADGEVGEIAVHRKDIHGHPDPVFFLGYWQNEQATRDKFTGEWGRTGDLATRDADGYLWYAGRADDMFKAAGYRIGPSEVENCLVKHPAVANAAVVPKPDASRGNLVKAYVVLAAGFEKHLASDTGRANLVADIQEHVRDKLAPYEYPKEIEFIQALPMTTTGKVQRRVLRLQEEARAKV